MNALDVQRFVKKPVQLHVRAVQPRRSEPVLEQTLTTAVVLLLVVGLLFGAATLPRAETNSSSPRSIQSSRSPW